jgi:topoisomerase-4 subunit A
MADETDKQPDASDIANGNGDGEGGGGELANTAGGNSHLRRLMDQNFLEYASYVIKDRAIPDIDDGLKPVQRRILWSLKRMDDGKFHKVANVIGHSMQFHPHGDASIYEALVVLANKDYFIERQGNFGNIFTGDVASAARYIECRLTPLAREVMFNNDITEFTDSYDGRNREPVVLPAKVPALLMLGAEGIAVGMSTRILPHNFGELLRAQVAILKKEPFTLYPDFQQGGLMDVSEYNDGNGRVRLRARIEIVKRKLVIREIPAATTTERLIASIEKAARSNKIKIAGIHDYTGEAIEIEVVPARGYDPEKALHALYAYTECSLSVTTSLLAIADNRPVVSSVSEVLRRNTDRLLEMLRRELEIELGKLNEAFHDKTLAQIFIENRIYQRIEKCESYELVLAEVRKGLDKFKHLLKRDITDDDIEKLLAIPIRRISLFDIRKNQDDLERIVADIAETEKNLKRLRQFAIRYLEGLLAKYADDHPRRTEIEAFDRIDVRKVALNNIKVGWDRGNSYVGSAVRSDETVTCNEFDKLLCIERNGKYKVIAIPDKLFVGRLYYFSKYDRNQRFYIVYSERQSGKCYAKQTVIDKFITDKEYELCPDGCRLELITTRPAVYEGLYEPKPRQRETSMTFRCTDAPERSPKARGQLISAKKIVKFSYLGPIEGIAEDGEAPPSPPPPDAEANANGAEAPDDAPAKSADQDVAKAKATTKDTPKDKPAPAIPPPGKGKAKPSAAKQAKPAAKPPATPRPKAEPQADKKPASRPGEPEVLTLEPAAESPRRTRRKPAPAPAAPRPRKPTKGVDDDWGISQPEFGF